MIAANYESRSARASSQPSLFRSEEVSTNEAPVGPEEEHGTTIVSLGRHANDIVTPRHMKICDPFKREKDASREKEGLLKTASSRKEQNQEVKKASNAASGSTTTSTSRNDDPKRNDFDHSLTESGSTDVEQIHSWAELMAKRDMTSVWSVRNKKYLNVVQAASLGDEEREDYWTLGESFSEDCIFGVVDGDEDCPPIYEEEGMENEDPTEGSTYSYLDAMTVDSYPAAKAAYRNENDQENTPKTVTAFLESPKMRRRRVLEESLRKMVGSSPVGEVDVPKWSKGATRATRRTWGL